MKLHIRFFATLKDRAGTDSISLDLPHNSTVGDLLSVLSEQFANLKIALPSALIAVNHEYAFPDSPLQEGDEIAIFPPVSGGSGEHWPEYFAVTKEQLDVDAIIGLITRPETGAVAVFAGAVRGMTRKPGMPEITNHLFYEAYEPMAEAMLRQVAAEIRERFPKVQGIAAVQRLGHLRVGETTILVACSSGHRNDGIFEAAHYGINRVKEIVPVWKKEVGPAGEVWIEGDYRPTPGDVISVSPDTFIIGCSDCDEHYSLTTTNHLCKCGAPLEITKRPAFRPDAIDNSTTSMWRYRDLIVPHNVEPVTLGEGWTPLVDIPAKGYRLLAKLESSNPSGSFKDRGTSVLMSVLHSSQISKVHDDSSGNAGASLAMYAARAGVQAKLFVPESASPAKLTQIEMYGAHPERIAGLRSASTDAAIGYGDNSYYASHVFHPIAMLGYSTISWELWEQLGRKLPDVVILPLGQGTQLIGIYDGFNALFEAQLISKIPKLIGVQAAKCAPVWERVHASDLQPNGETIAEGIKVNNPIRIDRVAAAIRDTHGDVIAVTEEEILEGFTQLARYAIFVEPTSAVVWAALKKIEDSISNDDTIVLIMTGTGLKSASIEQLTHLVSSYSRT